MSQLDKAKLFIKCKKVIDSCKNSSQHVIAIKYIELAKKYLSEKQYNFLSKYN